jgi:hypothetical protein
MEGCFRTIMCLNGSIITMKPKYECYLFFSKVYFGYVTGFLSYQLTMVMSCFV